MANFKQIMAMCLDGGSYAAISAALGCSNRDIAKTKTLIADLSITKESFAQLVHHSSTSTLATIAGPVASATTSQTSKSSPSD